MLLCPPALPENLHLVLGRLCDLRDLRSIGGDSPMVRVLTCAARFSATRRKARALSDLGMDWTMGFPSSEVVRISVERGISPKKGTSLAAANRRAPPLPKISSRWPQRRQDRKSVV